MCGRTLAAHGAEVLRLSAPHLPLMPHIWLDLARGKRSAHLDIDDGEDERALHGLIRECDIFAQAYRPEALAARGFGPADVRRLRPGAIYVTISPSRAR